jgi:nitroreductase
MSPVQKPASTHAPVNELIRHRWSPRAFEPRSVEPEKLRSVFEAARWAASTTNSQPWYYIVATRDDAENFARVLQCFNENNQAWAKHAPVIGLSVALTNFATSGKPNRFAFHDLGGASATLALEAVGLGLQIHQMGGIFPDKAREVFGVPEGYEVAAGLALGYPGDPQSLPDALRERELQPRQRKPVSEFVFSGNWGKPAPLLAPKG